MTIKYSYINMDYFRQKRGRYLVIVSYCRLLCSTSKPNSESALQRSAETYVQRISIVYTTMKPQAALMHLPRVQTVHDVYISAHLHRSFQSHTPISSKQKYKDFIISRNAAKSITQLRWHRKQGEHKGRHCYAVVIIKPVYSPLLTGI